MEKLYYKIDEHAKTKGKIGDFLKTCINAVDLLLASLKEKLPDKYDLIKDNIFPKVSENSLAAKVLQSNYMKIEDYPVLKFEPTLYKKGISLALNLLKLPQEKVFPLDEETEIDTSVMIRLYTHFEHDMAISLFSAMSREESLEYYKELNTETTKSRRNPETFLQTLNDFFNEKNKQLDFYKMQDAILELDDEGRVILKVTRCTWAEALEDMDGELGFSILCHADFENTLNYNPNFILTRNKTMMQGDEYCDFCYHDTRIEKEVKHPTVDYWESLT